MADTLLNTITGEEITSFIMSTSRVPHMTQVSNIALNGLVHIQNIGAISFQIGVEFIIHKSKEAALLNSYRDGHLMRVVDDDNDYRGYIIAVQLDNVYAEGYCRCYIVLQQEVIL